MDEQAARFVVVGGGPAAAAATRVLACAGGDVVVLSSEQHPPYDRTALSKQALLDPAPAPPPLWHPDETWPGTVDLRLGSTAVAVDRQRRVVTTDRGEELPYDSLLLATGAEPRDLAVPGRDGPGVHLLRDLDDSASLASTLALIDAGGAPLVVVGGGLIGLEVAAAARTRGIDVAVVEAGPVVLARGVPTRVAEAVTRLHRDHGVRFRLDATVVGIERGTSGEVVGVRLADGHLLPAGAVVIGVGIAPRDTLGRDAGLDTDDGILVDLDGRTDDPAVFAAGDAARFREGDGGRGTRLECYQSAQRQGEIAALGMLAAAGIPHPAADELHGRYDEVPWSWSDQYDCTLQSAGLEPPGAERLVIEQEDAVLVLSLAEGRLVAACGIAPGSAIARPVKLARQAITAGATLGPDARLGMTDLRTTATALRDSLNAVKSQ